jgi:hypothetical protein
MDGKGNTKPCAMQTKDTQHWQGMGNSDTTFSFTLVRHAALFPVSITFTNNHTALLQSLTEHEL